MMSFSAKPTRRDFFTLGGLSLGALSPLGLSLPRALAGEATGPRKKQINVIFLFLQGGASHIDMFDMRPNAPDDIRGKYSPAATKLAGLQLSDQLPGLRACADKFSLIRSMYTEKTVDHGEGDVHLMCGSPVDRNLQAPGIGAVLSMQQKLDSRFLPFVHMGNMKHPSHTAPGFGGFLGHQYDPYVLNQDPDAPDFSVPEFESPIDVDVSRLAGRKTLLRSLDRYQAEREMAFRSDPARDTFAEHAFQLATSRKAKEAFDLSREPSKVRDAYGRNRVGQGMLLARRLVEAGVRFVTIQGYVDTGIYAWDHHWGIFGHLDKQLPIYDQCYSALLNDLDDRGLLESTLVITAGEFGRTPKLNKDKQGPGRDHWSNCFSLTLGGGGVKTGLVIGASDRLGAVPKERPVSVPDFVATVYHALGLDPHAEFVAQGRPMKMLPKGAFVGELF